MGNCVFSNFAHHSIAHARYEYHCTCALRGSGGRVLENFCPERHAHSHPHHHLSQRTYIIYMNSSSTRTTTGWFGLRFVCIATLRILKFPKFQQTNLPSTNLFAYFCKTEILHNNKHFFVNPCKDRNIIYDEFFHLYWFHKSFHTHLIHISEVKTTVLF